MTCHYFVCAGCKKAIRSTATLEELQEQFKKEFPGEKFDMTNPQVCDPCFQAAEKRRLAFKKAAH